MKDTQEASKSVGGKVSKKATQERQESKQETK